MQKVTFFAKRNGEADYKRDDLKLAGLLFQPKNFTESEKFLDEPSGKAERSAVIIQGSGTSVKEQMGSLYSQKLAEQGFVLKAVATVAGSHFDYYDKPKQVNYAVEQITQFFGKH